MGFKPKQEKRFRRHKRVRAKIFGTVKRPRLCVFKSNKHIYAQLIDDEKGQVLAAASDQNLKPKAKSQKPKVQVESKKLKEKKEKVIKTGKVAIAFETGKLIADRAIKNKIEKVVFDKAGYRYQGRVKALAEGAREGGLNF
jgi:large subunit ribosomal protein L18